MSGAEYTYVVHDVIGLTKIAATFCRKYELVRYLRSQADEDGDVFGLEVFRCHNDDPDYEPVKLDIKELLDGRG